MNCPLQEDCFCAESCELTGKCGLWCEMKLNLFLLDAHAVRKSTTSPRSCWSRVILSHSRVPTAGDAAIFMVTRTDNINRPQKQLMDVMGLGSRRRFDKVQVNWSKENLVMGVSMARNSEV